MAFKMPTYDELMVQTPMFISECEGYLYVKLPAKERYENRIWKVDKKTHKVTCMMYVEYITSVMEHATYVVKPSWET